MNNSIPENNSFLECALITGASSGLGKEFASQLAPLCENIVLIARREDRLLAQKETLQEQNPSLNVIVIPADLSDENQRVQIFNTLNEKGLTPTLLINNAGLGDYGEFTSSEWEKVRSMLDVNMTALTHLSYHFLAGMKAKGTGAIINISSIASLVPIPDFTVYAATKAYVTSFTESLRSELLEHNIPVLAVCPGPVKTEFGDIAARNGSRFQIDGYNQLQVSAECVVTESLNALFQNKARTYPGWKVAVFATILTALPICLVRAINSKRPRRSVNGNNEQDI